MASCLMRTSWNPHLPESPWSAPHKNITAVQVRTSVCLLPHQNAKNLFWILQKIHNKKDNKRRHEWKSIFELNLRLKWLIKQNYIIQVFWFLSSGQLIFHFLLFFLLYFVSLMKRINWVSGEFPFFFFSILTFLYINSSGMLVIKMWNIDAFRFLCWWGFEKLEWKMKKGNQFRWKTVNKL